MRTIDLHTPSFGSSHDPVLHGVACGLADLFPPVHHPGNSIDERRNEPALVSEAMLDEEI